MKVSNYNFTKTSLEITFEEAPENTSLIIAIRRPNEQDRYHKVLVHGETKKEGVVLFSLNEISSYINIGQATIADLCGLNKFTGVLTGVTAELGNIDTQTFSTEKKDGCFLCFEKIIDSCNRISFKILKETEVNFCASVSQDSNSLLINGITNGFDLYLARRSSSSHNFLYECFVKLDYYDNLPLKNCFNSIQSFVKNGKEIWDFVVKKSDNLFPVTCKDGFLIDYTDINDSFVAKPFLSESKYLAIFVDDGLNKKQKKIKLAIIGSCYTKQAFHAIDFTNRDYKRFYENSLIIFHTTLESMMSENFKIDDKFLNPEESFDKRLIELYGQQEFKKDAIDKLKEYNPDYILIDLFAESRATLFKLNENCFVTDCFFFRQSPVENFLKNFERIKCEDCRRKELFKNSVKQFKNKIASFFPLNNIVLIKPKAAISYIDKFGNKKSFENPKWVSNANILWDEYNSIFINEMPECRTIDMRSGNYLGYEKSPFNLSSNHLESRYYKDLFNGFNKIVLQDLIKELK